MYKLQGIVYLFVPDYSSYSLSQVQAKKEKRSTVVLDFQMRNSFHENHDSKEDDPSLILNSKF